MSRSSLSAAQPVAARAESRRRPGSSSSRRLAAPPGSLDSDDSARREPWCAQLDSHTRTDCADTVEKPRSSSASAHPTATTGSPSNPRTTSPCSSKRSAPLSRTGQSCSDGQPGPGRARERGRAGRLERLVIGASTARTRRGALQGLANGGAMSLDDVEDPAIASRVRAALTFARSPPPRSSRPRTRLTRTRLRFRTSREEERTLSRASRATWLPSGSGAGRVRHPATAAC